MNFTTIKRENYAKVAEIYRQGIETGIATFETEVPDYETWDAGHLPFARIAAVEAGEVLGWAALSKVSDRCVYGGVAEVSIYIHSDHQRKGLGRMLLQKLIVESEKNGIWTLQCGIMRANKASVKLHKKCGFRIIGYREKVGELQGVWHDNILMERRSKVVGTEEGV